MKCTQCSREAEDAQFKMCMYCRELSRERARKRRQENPERNRAACKKWYNKNREYAITMHKQWKKANPERNKLNEINRRARKERNGDTLPSDIEDILFAEQNGFCYLCGNLLYGKLDDLVCIEHKTPLSRGGSNDISNVGLAHLSCNSKKFTKTYEEFVNKVQKT